MLELRLQLLERARLYGNAQYLREAAVKLKRANQPKPTSVLPKPRRLDLDPRQEPKRRMLAHLDQTALPTDLDLCASFNVAPGAKVSLLPIGKVTSCAIIARSLVKPSGRATSSSETPWSRQQP